MSQLSIRPELRFDAQKDGLMYGRLTLNITIPTPAPGGAAASTTSTQLFRVACTPADWAALETEVFNSGNGLVPPLPTVGGTPVHSEIEAHLVLAKMLLAQAKAALKQSTQFERDRAVDVIDKFLNKRLGPDLQAPPEGTLDARRLGLRNGQRVTMLLKETGQVTVTIGGVTLLMESTEARQFAHAIGGLGAKFDAIEQLEYLHTCADCREQRYHEQHRTPEALSGLMGTLAASIAKARGES